MWVSSKIILMIVWPPRRCDMDSPGCQRCEGASKLALMIALAGVDVMMSVSLASFGCRRGRQKTNWSDSTACIVCRGCVKCIVTRKQPGGIQGRPRYGEPAGPREDDNAVSSSCALAIPVVRESDTIYYDMLKCSWQH